MQYEYLSIQLYSGDYYSINDSEYIGDVEMDLYTLFCSPTINVLSLNHSKYIGSISFQVTAIELSETIFTLQFALIGGGDFSSSYLEYSISNSSLPSKMTKKVEKIIDSNTELCRFTKFEDICIFFSVMDFVSTNKGITIKILDKKAKSFVIFELPYIHTYRNSDENKIIILYSETTLNSKLYYKLKRR